MNQAIKGSLSFQAKNILCTLNNLNRKRKNVMIAQVDIKITKRLLSSIKNKKSLNFLDSKEINALILNLNFLRSEFFSQSQDENLDRQLKNFNILLEERLKF